MGPERMVSTPRRTGSWPETGATIVTQRPTAVTRQTPTATRARRARERIMGAPSPGGRRYRPKRRAALPPGSAALSAVGEQRPPDVASGRPRPASLYWLVRI